MRLLALFLILAAPLFSKVDPKNEKVLILGVCKDVAPFLPHMREKIEELGRCFKDYRIIIYENNSRDRTKELLWHWESENSKLVLFTEELTDEELFDRSQCRSVENGAPNRMELIAFARNITLQEAMKSDYDDYSFVIVTDLDFDVGWDPKKVVRSLSYRPSWDAIFANGMLPDLRYFDRYAFRDHRFPFGPELIGKLFWSDVTQQRFTFKLNAGFICVFSAFGGLGIYRRESMKNAYYSGLPTEDLKRYYEMIFVGLDENNHQLQAYRKDTRVEKGCPPVHFRANSGYDGPTVCEHLPLHATMALKGHGRFFVDSSLSCFYTK